MNAKNYYECRSGAVMTVLTGSSDAVRHSAEVSRGDRVESRRTKHFCRLSCSQRAWLLILILGMLPRLLCVS